MVVRAAEECSLDHVACWHRSIFGVSPQLFFLRPFPLCDADCVPADPVQAVRLWTTCY